MSSLSYDISKLLSILAAGGMDGNTNKTLLTKERIEAFMDAEPPVFDNVLGIPIAFSYGLDVKDDIVVCIIIIDLRLFRIVMIARVRQAPEFRNDR